MSRSDSFQDLLRQVQQGDDAAAKLLVEHYCRRLVHLAQGQLNSLIREKADPEGIVQSVFGVFFANVKQGEFEVIDNWQALWHLLRTITIRKCGDRRDKLRAAKRDAARTRPLADGGAAQPWQDLIDKCAPDPAESLLLQELVERLLHRFTGQARQIVQLTLDGRSTEEIVEILMTSPRSVSRVRKRLKELLEELARENEDE